MIKIARVNSIRYKQGSYEQICDTFLKTKILFEYFNTITHFNHHIVTENAFERS